VHPNPRPQKNVVLPAKLGVKYEGGLRRQSQFGECKTPKDFVLKKRL